MRASRLSLSLLAVASTLVLAGCGGRAADNSLLRESFDSGDTFSRTVDGRPAEACEAARRTLLSQGYAIARADDGQVEGNKNFQVREDDHEQLVLRISCAPRGSEQALVFVSAVQDRYALKKSPTSASVGVGALGSVSLPFGSNDDSLVKVASSTITDSDFYRRFFDRLHQYLPAAAAAKPTPAPAPQPAALQEPAPAAVPAPAPAPAVPATPRPDEPVPQPAAEQG